MHMFTIIAELLDGMMRGLVFRYNCMRGSADPNRYVWEYVTLPDEGFRVTGLLVDKERERDMATARNKLSAMGLKIHTPTDYSFLYTGPWGDVEVQ